MGKKIISNMQNQNKRIIDTSLIGKAEVFRMLALAEATGLPILLIGEPGVGKTKTVIEYAKSWLLQGVDTQDPEAMKKAHSEFMDKIYILETDEGTKSSEVKGLPDLEKLAMENRYELCTPIADAEVVIINEVDKASSAIRNSLLGVMNEKFLFNGKHKIPCKWKIFVATCNEIPKEEEGNPFWDRFVLKLNVSRASAAEILKYYKSGDRSYRERTEVTIPTRKEMDNIKVNASKLDKYLRIAHNKCSDRTLTFVPTLTKAASVIWNMNIDTSLIKVAGITIDSAASAALSGILITQEVKTVLSKIDMLSSMRTEKQLRKAVEDIGTIIQSYIAAGKLDGDQITDLEEQMAAKLEAHDVKITAPEEEEVPAT